MLGYMRVGSLSVRSPTHGAQDDQWVTGLGTNKKHERPEIDPIVVTVAWRGGEGRSSWDMQPAPTIRNV